MLEFNGHRLLIFLIIFYFQNNILNPSSIIITPNTFLSWVGEMDMAILLPKKLPTIKLMHRMAATLKSTSPAL